MFGACDFIVSRFKFTQNGRKAEFSSPRGKIDQFSCNKAWDILLPTLRIHMICYSQCVTIPIFETICMILISK